GKSMRSNFKKTEKRFHILGWLLFLACSVLFIIEGVRNSSIVGLAAGIGFLLGCVAFLIPLVLGGDRNGK
ncbi:MAG: hypothetical protein ACE5IA_07305, partial [Dehalococcoidia bacterium]